MNTHPTEDAATREARRWYARLLSPECGPGERADFQRWHDADPRHAARYRHVSDLMGRVGELKDDWALRMAARDALHAPRPASRPLARRLLAVAAVVAVLALGVGAMRLQQGESPVERHATTVGEQRRVTLADGSQLLLDTATEVEVRYSRRERRVVLASGRADYQVARDTRRPFVVEVLGGTTTALGTRFQTDLRGDQVQVSLLEGSVAVAGPLPGQRLTLAVGEQARYGGEGRVWARTAAPLAFANGWTQGKLVFEDVPLAELVAEANRYSGSRMRIGDPAIEQLRISGTFQADDRDSLLLALQGIWGIQARPQAAGGVLLVR